MLSYTFHTPNNLRPLIFLICFSLVPDVASAVWNVCTLNVISWPSLWLAVCPPTFDRVRLLFIIPDSVLMWHFCDRPMMQTKCHVSKEIWPDCAVSFFLCLLACCIMLLQWILGLFQHLSFVQYFYWRKYICPTQLIPFYSTNSYTFYFFKQYHHLAVQELVEGVIYNDAIGIAQEWHLKLVTTYIYNKTF